ncbi:hypothetical protein [Bradyrhizobium sp. CCBAU 45389]|uniref:hypothetical protein n=1 Tax=Bradyrhizobium sp. CCBAU 45389 TaxID=858429 RepID=UPI002305B90F|nr:hypothetical protein [Bradyrhizobium sp. CCBAU 45389]MDA9398774.1 hypothetical protein [Bradyrhizobium sp. CCBAU 45389]
MANQSRPFDEREFQVSFQGEAKIQTVFFNDQATNQANANSITSFLDRLGPAAEPPKQAELKSTDARRAWKGVAGAEVANLLASLLFPDEARDVNAGRLSSYIREQLGAGELVCHDASKSPARSPLFTSVLFNHYSTYAAEGYLSS